MELEKALSAAKEAAAGARQILLRHFRNLSKVREKGVEGLVSEADVESEKHITAVLKKAFPDIPILGEEGAAEAGSYQVPDSAWIVDPLDGTTNYVHGFSIFNVSIGLRLKGELVAGVIDVPLLNDTYEGVVGRGAFKNGQPIRVSRRSNLHEALLATGFYPHNRVDLKEQITIFSDLVEAVRGVRRAGAAAYDLALVAEGVFDGFWEKNLKPWDAAAGVLLVREAGGKVCNYDGGPYHVTDKGLLASNAALSEVLFKRLKKSIGQK